MGVAQPVHRPGDLAASAALHADAVRSAGARLVVFPELSLTGYDHAAPAVEVDDPVLEPIVEACAATGSTALVGAPVSRGGLWHIATLGVTGAGAAVAYCKTFLGDDETAAFDPGPGPAVLEVDGWRLGLGICKDTRITAHIEGTLALGVDLYVAGLVHRVHERAELAARADRIVRQGGVPVAFASAAGFAGRLYPETAGHSAIWSSSGALLARASDAPGEIATASLVR